jgi:putative membrane protein
MKGILADLPCTISKEMEVVNMMVIPVILLGLVIWGIMVFTRRSTTPGMTNEGSAIEILKKRYARGDISKEEFEERKKNLL